MRVHNVAGESARAGHALSDKPISRSFFDGKDRTARTGELEKDS
jgi:hypothetical protein